ncbi:MAG TPA: tetratricopeptide repeat protein [Thermoanaerobaculia bacterium]|nr:tetratricopeptide repeat protein [Thermoanaerobaculia bacterium]
MTIAVLSWSLACDQRADRGAQTTTTAVTTEGEASPSALPGKTDPLTPESARADQLLEAGEWRQALDAFYQLAPSREVLKKRAYAHTRLWELQPAIRILRDARDRYPDDIEIPGYLAAALTLNRELDEARALYREVLEKAPENDNARAGYALALAWSDELDAAGEEYRKVLARDPRHREARLGLGDVLSWQKRFDQAVAEYDAAAAVTTDPRSKSDALGRSGRAFAWKGDLTAALDRYEQALAIHPRNVEALLGQGEVYEWLREYRRAKAAYESVLRVVPEHPAAKAKLLQLMWVE